MKIKAHKIHFLGIVDENFLYNIPDELLDISISSNFISYSYQMPNGQMFRYDISGEFTGNTTETLSGLITNLKKYFSDNGSLSWHQFQEWSDFEISIREFIEQDKRSIIDQDIMFIAGPSSPNTIFTGNGNNIVVPGVHQDVIMGGNDVDTIIFSVPRDDFLIDISGNNIIITDINQNPFNVNYTQNIERFVFEDGTLAFDFDGVAGQVYRLYQAALARTPDPEGIGYWIRELDQGLDIADLSLAFIVSEEFESMYGSNISNIEFVDTIYLNVLNRNSDEEGLKFWANAMEQGLSRDQILLHFSESEENKTNTESVTSDGIWFI